MKLNIISLLTILLLSTTATAQKKITNELIWASPEFNADYIDGLSSLKDGLHYSSLESSDAFGSRIVKYSYATGEEVGVIATSVDVFKNANKRIEGYEMSHDEKYILITTDIEPQYRHSYFANFYVHNLETRKTTPVADFSKGKQMLATLSPDGQHVAFVRDNNIYITHLETGKETQITTDGEKNKIINGATDWVYEEEFALVKGLYWSCKGDRLAYYRFDESQVREFSMDMFGGLYPEQERFKYPKAGEKNSVVSIYIYDMNTKRSTIVATGDEPDQYIPRIKWTQNNDKLCVLRMNRLQNKLEYLMTDLSQVAPFAHDVKVIYTEKADTYVDINDALTFLKDGSFIMMSERDGYNHLYLMDANGNVKQQLTSGKFDVIDFYGYDETTMTAYYSSSEMGAIDKQIYSVTAKKKPVVKRLSTRKGHNDAQFSKGFKYYIINHSDANSPNEYHLYNAKGQEIRVLKDNARLKERLKNYDLTKKEFFTFTNSTNTTLNCWMMKPTDFDPNKKYPVLVAIYGGPGSNTVLDAWGGRNYMWHQMLCQQGYIVVSCDPRGTQFRGRDFKHSTYMNLGKNETADFIDLAKYLGNQSYIDKDRIGIQGWSFGGYMTSLCMTKGSDYYKAGIAVAPVTNWKYYDTIYTERFLRTPQENSGGYENNSPINFVDALKGKFLIIHGSADDNVHYQNTMDMVTALVAANKQFEMFIYPNKNHGIYGGMTRLHLYNKMTNFLKENL
ncbi:MAG TPA: S9 family peptidase [Flavobacteriales bacterium]